MKQLVLLISILTTISAGAATSSSDTIKRMSANTKSITVIWPTDSWGDATSNECSTTTNVLSIDTSTEAGKSILSIALSAMMSGKKVTFVTSTTECLPVGGYAPAVSSINVFN
ncbi:MAG: hypothetical protein ABJD02_07020 [Paraglaciecola sp.]|uniref:hypothetical protein n=1 Tax=Paraglaciecola sp. TaxID=1920173 RepID=UPI0032648901